MAKAGYTAEVGAPVALVAATAKTVLAVIAPAQFGIDLVKYRIGFDGVTASAIPVLVEIVAFTTDGTGTSGTVNQAYGRTITPGFTTKYNYSVEPTVPTALDRFTMTPNGGTIVYDAPRDGSTLDQAVSALLGIRCTAPAAVNVNATMWVERC
jgi:hypothetical protein